MKRYISIILVLSIIFALAACGKKQTTAEESTTVEEGFEVVEDTTTEKAETTETATNENGETVTEETTEEEEEEDDFPETIEEVVAAYKMVMDQAKQQDKPGFTRLDYQELPSDSENRVISSGGALVNTALSLADRFFATKEEAEQKPTIDEKGGSMPDFPVKGTNYGCLLKGTEGVKTAKCEKLQNGYYKITITYISEKNPEPAKAGATSAPSIHGSVCSPISKEEIDSKLATDVFSDISYSLTYHDCETVLIYNPENNHIYSQEQTNHVTIKGQGTVGFVTLGIEKQELINHVVLKDFKY